MKNGRIKSLVISTFILIQSACLVAAPPDETGKDGSEAFTDDGSFADGYAADPTTPDAGTAADVSGIAPDDASTSEDGSLTEHCAVLRENLKDELQTMGSCTVVLRQVPYGLITEFQIVCGDYNMVNEAQARTVAESITTIDSQANLIADSPDDEYVFYDPADTVGAAAVVSARTGLGVFAATLDSEVRSGNVITHPTSWRPVSELGPQCYSRLHVDPEIISAYELVDGTAVEMPAEWPLIAAAGLSQTVLVDAMVAAGYIFDLVVLYYAPLGFGPADGIENILLLNGGWLE